MKMLCNEICKMQVEQSKNKTKYKNSPLQVSSDNETTPPRSVHLYLYILSACTLPLSHKATWMKERSTSHKIVL